MLSSIASRRAPSAALPKRAERGLRAFAAALLVASGYLLAAPWRS